jgi:hypothetical protein
LLTIVVDILSLRPAAENPPLSTTWTNVVKLVSRSIGARIIRSHWMMFPLFIGLRHRVRRRTSLAFEAGHQMNRAPSPKKTWSVRWKGLDSLPMPGNKAKF